METNTDAPQKPSKWDIQAALVKELTPIVSKYGFTPKEAHDMAMELPGYLYNIPTRMLLSITRELNCLPISFLLSKEDEITAFFARTLEDLRLLLSQAGDVKNQP